MIEYTQKRQRLAETRLSNLNRDLANDHPIRKHSEHLLDLMIRHGDKEQVIDRFDRDQLGEAWDLEKSSGVTPRIKDGTVGMKGILKRPGRVAARRMLAGPGRFVEYRAEMRIGSSNGVLDFAGLGVEIAVAPNVPVRFRIRVGVDDRDELVILMNDGTKALEPIRTKLRVTKDEWHAIVISVDDADDAKISGARFLKLFFDGQQMIPAARSQLRTLKRKGSLAQQFVTEFRAEGKPGATLDLAFRNYRRVQIQKQ